MKSILLLFTAIILYAFTGTTKQDKDLETLYALMQGSFNSAEQAEADSTFYDISLHMYPIWEEKGHFLYVEQALSSMQNKPYRQRIYELKRCSDSTFCSYVYKIPNNSLWIGKWENADNFNTLNFEDLDPLTGCEVILKRHTDEHYAGETGEKTCQSVFRGASYANSEVSVFPGKITSWDRGFDAEGNHVWGAVKRGYIFKKINQ
ncbi:chromophore lyase CpcT/CpeT [Flavobacteriales bacterium]|nr:chromophore lyase CpcT/CpeT [Flavobacteriales bacterium]